jgi:hypothetical protein
MAASGVCAYCGITDAEVDGDRLRWHDANNTCCSKYACVKRHQAEARKNAPAPPANRKYGDRYRGWGPGAIWMDLRRRARRRKKRAA